MVGALLFLRLTSLRNLVAHRLGRLRQPKYLLGAAFAVAYFYYFVFRRIGAAGTAAAFAGQDARTTGMIAAGFICGVLCVIGVVRVAYAWIAPPEKPGLAFTEAEIAFLFPAPITRRALIHYRLLSAQMGILFSAVLITVVFNRSGYMGGHRALHAVGWWVILSTIDLHVNGTNLTLGYLREKSSHFNLWRVAAVAAIALYLAAVYRAGFGAVNSAFSAQGARGGMNGLIDALRQSQAFHWLTLPFRIVLGPYLAVTYADFALALGPALAVLGLHYWWVSSSQVRFEEGSIAIAARRAAMRGAMQRGESLKLGGKAKALPGPFPLPPRGLPEVAFLWKNLLSLRSSIFSRRSLGIVIGIGVWAYFGVQPLMRARGLDRDNDAVGFVVLTLCAVVAGYTLILGPQIARQDLRSDLPNADLLKTYPMEGWRLALGELLAPTAILTAILWVTILAAAAAFDTGGRIEWLTSAVRATVVLCLGLTAPILCMIQLIVPNTIMVLMPGWYQASRTRGGGVEMFGQRLMFGLLQLMFALLVIVPAAGAAAIILGAAFGWNQFLSGMGLHISPSPAVVLATLAAVLILMGEAAVGLWFLGERFERFDLSTETR
jgi:ABC-2 type transport system permease protein